MPDAKSEILKGTLDMLILKVVALGPIHGYAISQRIQQISRDHFRVQQGTLYPALHRLENRGLLCDRLKFRRSAPIQETQWSESPAGTCCSA